MSYLSYTVDLIRDWYWIPLILAYVGVIVTILLDNRNPSKSIAYVLVLALLPGLGLVVYYFFGRDYRKERIFNIKGSTDEPIIDNFWKQNLPIFEHRIIRAEAQVHDLIAPARLLFNLHQGLLTEHNHVKLLINGEQKFPEVYSALQNATHHIHLEYYIFSYDDVGKKIVDILLRKAAEGVEVRVIIDDFGSQRNGKFVRKLRKGGVLVERFMPVTFGFAAQANYRNHRKIIVIDGQVGFIGGMNIDDRYLNNGKHKLFWRDIAFRIEGEAVNLLQFQFLLSWKFVTKKTFPIQKPYFGTNMHIPEKIPITVVASGPDSPRPYCMEAIVAAIHQAKHKIWITNPYFVPTDQIMTALQIAASNGVDVQLLLPGKSDSYIVKHASYTYLQPLLESGAKVYLYQKGFVHAKSITIDNQLAIVGTPNMDIRSFFINFEIAALIYDPSICQQLDYQFEQDLKHCTAFSVEIWSKRPFINQFIDSVCRLLTPLL